MSVRKKIKVSVLVPAFNEEENVERAYAAIVSVFRDLPDCDYEIIVTDNHSTDRTYNILQEIAARDPKVRVIRFSRNNGYERGNEKALVLIGAIGESQSGRISREGQPGLQHLGVVGGGCKCGRIGIQRIFSLILGVWRRAVAVLRE